MEQKENGTVSVSKTEQGTDAEKKVGSTVLGKFKDVRALEEAYSALEAEFTRRSQRIKELEKAVENRTQSEAEKPSESEGGVKADFPDRPTETPENSAVDENASIRTEDGEKPLTDDELFSAANENERVRLKIIGDYLSSLGKSVAPITKGGVGTLATSPKKAKSVTEAGEMALHFFKAEKNQA